MPQKTKDLCQDVLHNGIVCPNVPIDSWCACGEARNSRSEVSFKYQGTKVTFPYII